MLLFQPANAAYSQRGSEITNMLNQLTLVERSDAVFPEYTLLISDVFTQQKPDNEVRMQLTGFLLSAASSAGKRYLLNEIAATGSNQAISFLTGLLGMETTASLALQTLSGMPSKQVDKELIKAFSSTSAKIQAGILTSLGEREDKKSISFLYQCIQSDNNMVAGAAIAALGRIGNKKAASVLLKEYNKRNHPLQEALSEALLKCASQMQDHADNRGAFAIYSNINKLTSNDIQKTAAIRGMMLTTPGQPDDILKAELQNASPSLKPSIARLAGQLPEHYDRGSELLQLPGLSDDIKLRLITVRAQNGDKTVRAAALAFLDHPDVFYRESAIQAMSLIAGPDDVMVFASHAAGSTGNEKELSRLALYRIPGEAADLIIRQQATHQDEKTSAELVRAVAERNILTGTAMLLEAAKGQHPEVRMEAYRSLALTANREHLESIMQLLERMENSRERQELERTLSVIATVDPPANGTNGELIRYMESAPQTRDKISMLAVLGNVRNPGDLSKIMPYLKNENPELKLAALRALSDWPDAGPMYALREIVTVSDDIRFKTLALRAHTQVITNDINLSGEEKAAKLAFGLDNAPNSGEKRLVMAALGRVPSPASLAILTGQLSTDTELKQELEAAVISMAKTLMESEPEKTKKILQDALKFTENEEIIRMSAMKSDKN